MLISSHRIHDEKDRTGKAMAFPFFFLDGYKNTTVLTRYFDGKRVCGRRQSIGQWNHGDSMNPH